MLGCSSDSSFVIFPKLVDLRFGIFENQIAVLNVFPEWNLNDLVLPDSSLGIVYLENFDNTFNLPLKKILTVLYFSKLVL